MLAKIQSMKRVKSEIQFNLYFGKFLPLAQKSLWWQMGHSTKTLDALINWSGLNLQNLSFWNKRNKAILDIQAALVICGLFICDFAYIRSRNDLFSITYPLIISHPWSFYIRIHYIQVYFWSPYPSHITRSNCTVKLGYYVITITVIMKLMIHGFKEQKLVHFFISNIILTN